ncbi:MAG: HDIG domain-containing protein [Parcubacteria group bacterium]|nr:HDIG domain-containing protein [Parcubacteria group bacterium]
MAENFRERATQLLNEHIKNRNLIKHNLAAGALLKALAFHFGKNDEAGNWELAGLLHDLDWEKTEEDPSVHTSLTAKILQENNFPPAVIEAIKRHNRAAGNPPPETLLEKVLYYTEEITGLIVASTLILPSKKLADLTVDSVLRRLKEKSFARGIDRELLKEMPNQINLSLEELIATALKTMQGMSGELGL